MSISEDALESVIQSRGLTAPRITPQDIDQSISSADYYVFPGTTLTVCCLTLTNGFTVVGESACASPENFDPELGRTIAFQNARSKIWALEGYRLRSDLAENVLRLTGEAAQVLAEALENPAPLNDKMVDAMKLLDDLKSGRLELKPTSLSHRSRQEDSSW